MIKDYGRGLIIGDSSTFGKGTVQSIVQIRDHTRRNDRKNRGALKLTIQQFYRANGDSTQINGVSPHVHLPSLRDYMDFGEGKMDNALKFEKVPELPHDDYNKISPDLVTLLNERSAQRRKDDPKFQKQQERIKQFLDRKARHSIALNEAKFKSEYCSRRGRQGARRRRRRSRRTRRRRSTPSARSGRPTSTTTRSCKIVGDYLTLGSKVLAANPVRAAANR